MGKAVLGLNFGHDRSACLAVDGQPRVAIAEERLSRRKHDIPLNDRGERYNHFPHRAVGYCLAASGLGLRDIGLVVASTTYVLDTSTGARRNMCADDVVRQCPALSQCQVDVVPHHLSHAASVALCSGFPSAAVLVVDGGGSIIRHENGVPAEFERSTIFHFRDGKLLPLTQVSGGPPVFGNSIGDLYQVVTNYLGFRSGEEGKTMGLAGYQDMARERPRTTGDWAPLVEFDSAIAIKPDGWHNVSEVFQFTADAGFHHGLTSAFGERRAEPRPDQALDRHIAASAQYVLEGAMLRLAAAAYRLTGESRLCLAGGVALNCVANGRILREGPFGELFIQPAAGDDGAALGNALLGLSVTGIRQPDWTFRSPYLGRTYTDDDIDTALCAVSRRVIVRDTDDRPEEVAEDIAAGRIVAVFRGGCEFGPRALGHRSILCDPRQPGMKDHLNKRVKHRESFRPFAPMVLEERAVEYFDLPIASPYMLLAAAVRQPDVIPAVTHVDGSARVQTVSRDGEPFLHAVISSFMARTRVPVLLNTSFNDQEPIVETPADALRCFLRTGIDVLYLAGRRVVRADS